MFRPKAFWLVTLIVMLATPVIAWAQDMLPVPRLGEGRTIEIAPKPMYTYLDGKRTGLEQDLGFVTLAFKKPLSKDERHKYYKKIRLTVSELQEPAAVDKGYFVLRLMPGATERKWNVYAEYLKHDVELSFVGRVFKSDAANKLKDLWAATRDITVRFKGATSEEEMRRVEANYPVLLKEAVPTSGQALFEIQSIDVDTLDLANRMQESGEFLEVSPVFVILKGQPVTEALKAKMNRELMEAVPPRVKKDLDEKAKKMQQEMEKAPAAKPPKDPHGH